jgi:hypothetical protein
VRLLPVESRAQDTPIADLKADPRHWVHYPLNVQVPEQMAGTLREIQQTKDVSLAEASRLGLSSLGLPGDGRTAPQRVQVPKWRYAIVSFPHSLLRQGLVILATPGAAALGQEPELTTGLIPAVQAVLFVVAADEGVTANDLQLWQQHLKGFQSERQRAMLVALNKVDLLWDRLRDGAAIDQAVASLRGTAPRRS